MSDEPTVTPDDKDWTWVLREPCHECGFDPAASPPEAVLAGLTTDVARWREVLLRPDVRVRPAPGTWSPLEYACHVRDMLDVMAARARAVRDEDAPTFPSWDQDDAAVRRRYAEDHPLAVADEVAERADRFAGALAGAQDDEWARRGLRSDGTAFTLDTLVRYAGHELVHHAHDVGA